jgi:hypothetical protein
MLVRMIPTRMTMLALLVPAALLWVSAVDAATTVTLPPWVCSSSDTIFRSGFADGEQVPRDASNGSGGAGIGTSQRYLHIAGLGTGNQTYYVYVPNGYTPSRPWPLVIALHGLAPWSSRNSYGSATRNDWASVISATGFLVAAPVADDQVDVSGTPGATWRVPPASAPTDYDLIAAVIADMEGAYNVERTRIYGWGFSAGAHVMHDLALGTYSPPSFGNATIAAYGISAGGLQQLVCPTSVDASCSLQLSAVPRKLPVDIYLGNTDPLYTNATKSAGDDPSILANAGWVMGQNLQFTLFNGPHTYTTTQLSDIWAHLCPYAVVP